MYLTTTQQVNMRIFRMREMEVRKYWRLIKYTAISSSTSFDESSVTLTRLLAGILSGYYVCYILTDDTKERGCIICEYTKSIINKDKAVTIIGAAGVSVDTTNESEMLDFCNLIFNCHSGSDIYIRVKQDSIFDEYSSKVGFETLGVVKKLASTNAETVLVA